MSMKITLKQYGGFAAAVRRAPLVVDTADLGEQRNEVEQLAHAVSTQPSAAAASAEAPHPDEIGYTLLIDGENGSCEVRCMGTSASPEFASLVQQVRRCGKAEAS